MGIRAVLCYPCYDLDPVLTNRFILNKKNVCKRKQEDPQHPQLCSAIRYGSPCDRVCGGDYSYLTHRSGQGNLTGGGPCDSDPEGGALDPALRNKKFVLEDQSPELDFTNVPRG